MRPERFWDSIRGVALNSRQALILYRLPEGFEGNLTSEKYVKLAKRSPDIAPRDIQGLISATIPVRSPGGGGRSTSYALRRPAA